MHPEEGEVLESGEMSRFCQLGRVVQEGDSSQKRPLVWQVLQPPLLKTPWRQFSVSPFTRAFRLCEAEKEMLRAELETPAAVSQKRQR
ncbi:hypothetical protein SKAU_G00064320 [Synaphobranchus kaupii]|uniref:Uncharacterized protein n=1 Tax=Synaphobranchus kaupii TaxID=118154 RepID=A0A9Q1G6J0_SYNKA|nr:hypothetical protein SKAU_G00064320 [Synaphobranchus kaupii]